MKYHHSSSGRRNTVPFNFNSYLCACKVSEGGALMINGTVLFCTRTHPFIFHLIVFILPLFLFLFYHYRRGTYRKCICRVDLLNDGPVDSSSCFCIRELINKPKKTNKYVSCVYFLSYGYSAPKQEQQTFLHMQRQRCKSKRGCMAVHAPYIIF